jgi:hypothetical protein
LYTKHTRKKEAPNKYTIPTISINPKEWVAAPAPSEDKYRAPIALAVTKGEEMLMSGMIKDSGMANSK